MERHTDDHELLDGIPRWVWRLDDLCSKMARDEALYEVPRLVEATARDRKVGKMWLAHVLEDCRRIRNVTTGKIQVIH